MNIKNTSTGWDETSGSSISSENQMAEDSPLYTSGSLYRLGDFDYSSFQGQSDISSQAKKILVNIEDETVRKKAETLLLYLQSIISNFISVSELPPLKAYQTDDKTLVFEWIFPHFRVGFSIEQSTGEVDWYLTSDNSAGDIMASGKIFDGTRTESILYFLLQYVSLNY